MVEVNTMGYMIGSKHKDYFDLAREQRAVLRLAGASGFPERRKYAAELTSRSERFCAASSGCERAQRLEIEEMVHEDMHCGYQWYRIFPTLADRPHTAALKKEPKYAMLLTPLDRLMFAWLKEGWAPRHRTDANGTVWVSDSSQAGMGQAARPEPRRLPVPHRLPVVQGGSQREQARMEQAKLTKSLMSRAKRSSMTV